MSEIEEKVRDQISLYTQRIKKAAETSRNEAEFRTQIAILIEEIASHADLNLHLREEYTLINGRADAVYNRLVIEYEPPRSLRPNNSARTNQHAIDQVKRYIDGLVRLERHKPERLAGVVLDGYFFIFVRKKNGIWHIDDPLQVDDYSTEYFIKLLFSLSNELALIPENLEKDFGENTQVSRKTVRSLYKTLISTDNPKVKTIFEQWSLQFSEVCDYERASKLKIDKFARKFGIKSENLSPFHFFFTLHTYYAIFIKLLALQIVHYYTFKSHLSDLKQLANSDFDNLKHHMEKIEDGAIFRELGIKNFIEGDFFRWYLEVWNNGIYESVKLLLSTLANYSLLTLDVDPDTTRDLLKKLYQRLMPKELRHNLGEYYTPDWLAERLLNMLEGGKFKGDPDKRILDPACGSGTFLVLAIKKIREYARTNKIPETRVLEKILSNVVGFDLNPLAVISARTNYLLALGELLKYRAGEISIPVYLCDSILTPQEGTELFEQKIVKFNTAVGPFFLPKSLIQAQYIDLLADFLEEAVKLNLSKEHFIQKLCEKLPLIPKQDAEDIEVVYKLYEKLLTLEKEGINGIWARIIKNAFAPLFVREFDYIVGNPPWINWEHLPEGYRESTKSLWIKYRMAATKGKDKNQFELGKQKRDISALMTYISIDNYLKRNGKLGFLLTQSVFKTNASSGFRRFRLPDNLPIKVLHVDDMVELNPFEGASNRTSVVIIQKGASTRYPMPSYLYWKKTVKGKSIPLEASLDEVISMTERKQFIAEPVNENDFTSPWITGRQKALKGVKKILGKSEYKAYAGVCGWANSIYWVDIIANRSDGLLIISNITKKAKRKVESIQCAIESDLLYPLLRSGDLIKWNASSSVWIILPHTPETSWQAVSEVEMKTKYPKTYLYFKRFEPVLANRSGYKLLRKGHPFYILVDIHKETFAPYKVVWTRISKIEAAVVSQQDGKPIIPQETITYVALDDENEAHFLCAMVNSSPFQFAAISYSQAGGKSMGSPHVLEYIHIPKFDVQNKLHIILSELSKKAHEFAALDDKEKLKEVEDEIDKVAAQIWGLTSEELKEIKRNLEELGRY